MGSKSVIRSKGPRCCRVRAHLPRVLVPLHHLVSSLHVLPVEDFEDLDLDISLLDPSQSLVLEPAEKMRLIGFVSSTQGRSLDRESLEEYLREVEVRDLGARHEGEEDESAGDSEGGDVLVEIIFADEVEDLQYKEKRETRPVEISVALLFCHVAEKHSQRRLPFRSSPP